MQEHGRRLRRARGAARAQLGPMYVLDIMSGAVVETHVDLLELGTRLDCLQPWERVAPAGGGAS